MIKCGFPSFIEKCFNVLPCGQRIVFVHIAIAIPSLSDAENEAFFLRFREAGRNLFVSFFTHLAKRSACVSICYKQNINVSKMLVSKLCHNVHIGTSKSDSFRLFLQLQRRTWHLLVATHIRYSDTEYLTNDSM